MTNFIAVTQHTALQVSDTADLFAAAYAPSTLKAIRCDLNVIRRWLATHNQTVITPQVLTEFITDMATTKKVATIKRYLASLSMSFRDSSENPCKSPIVKLAMRAIARQKGTEQKQSTGFTAPAVKQCVESAGDSKTDKRNIAILLVSRDLMSRVGELHALNVDDVVFENNGAVITIKRSKTDKTGNGVKLFIGAKAANALREYMTACGVNDGALFRGINRWQHTKGRLSITSLSSIIKQLALTAGLQGVTAHGTRVGMAQDLLEKGFAIADIAQAGRWRNFNQALHYVSKIRPQNTAIARYHSIC